jgi:type IV pilus assembly protein PilF
VSCPAVFSRQYFWQPVFIVLLCLFASACQTTRPLASADAERVDLRLQLATAYLERGQPNVALTEVTRALDVDPSSARAYNIKAFALMALQRVDAAKQAMQAAATLAPADLSYQHNLGWFQCMSGDVEQALQTFDAVILRAANDFNAAQTHLSLGVCAIQAKRFELAERALSQAVVDARYTNAANFGLATLMVQSENWPAALRFLASMSRAYRVSPAVLNLQMQIDAQYDRMKQAPDDGMTPSAFN